MYERLDDFCWNDLWESGGTDAERYQAITRWAMRARGQNPDAFDRLTDWILDDGAWTAERMEDNERMLMRDVIARFRAQNAGLRDALEQLRPSGVVNEAVFGALDRFDGLLSGQCEEARLAGDVRRMFDDFSSMQERSVRENIAGGRTGSAGTDTVSLFGYINELKNGDAAVQWALFMPEVVEKQQQGFRVERFEYKTMPAMRFIGFEGPEYDDPQRRVEKMKALDALSESRCGLDADVLFMHHYGCGVDVGPWHGMWGRFMKAQTPVPEGFAAIDLVPEFSGHPGPPYMSQFACAVFSGDAEALHRREGYDSDAMYDVTRNIILGQDVMIPYPEKYWTAEVFPDGCGQPGSVYLFSVDLQAGEK